LAKYNILHRERFAEEFEQLTAIYFDVKDKILLAENLMGKFPIVLPNELRNSFDHLFRVCVERKNLIDDDAKAGEEVQNQFVSASRHLKRAGYDACELAIMAYTDEIEAILEKYEVSELVSVMGDEYILTVNIFKEIKAEHLVNARRRKNTQIEIEDDEEIDTLYPEFMELVTTVEARRDNLMKFIIPLENFRAERDKKKRKSKRNAVLFFILGAIISIAIERGISYILDDNSPEQNTEVKNTP